MREKVEADLRLTCAVFLLCLWEQSPPSLRGPLLTLVVASSCESLTSHFSWPLGFE